MRARAKRLKGRNDDTGVEIVFQDANASDPALNRPPAGGEATYMRQQVIPQRLHFIIHVKTWSMGTVLPTEVRDKVLTVKTRSEMDSLYIGRHTLRLNDVIGLHTHPDKAIWSLTTDVKRRHSLDSLDASADVLPAAADPNEQAERERRMLEYQVRQRAILPTLVVHVPSNLNPGYQDAMIEFGPKTMSWLHRPVEAADSTDARPRVIVPLHLKRDHPALAHHSKRKPEVPRAQTARQPSASAAVRKSSKVWSEGWLPFPYHNSSSREKAGSFNEEKNVTLFG